MATTYFIADLHLGDKKVMELDGRPFPDIAAQDAELIRRWNEKVKDNDRVFILGDLSAYDEEKTVAIVSQLRGKKHFLRGNHDKLAGPKFTSLFESVQDYLEVNVDGKHVVLCHYPIAHWKGQRYGYLHLFGHTHRGQDDTLWEMYRALCKEQGLRFYGYNVGCMFHDYYPVSIEEIIAKELLKHEQESTE